MLAVDGKQRVYLEWPKLDVVAGLAHMLLRVVRVCVRERGYNSVLP